MISVVLTDFYISQKCHGVELEILESYLSRATRLQHFIKEINGDKIALSLKFEDTNPWLTLKKNLQLEQLLQVR